MSSRGLLTSMSWLRRFANIDIVRDATARSASDALMNGWHPSGSVPANGAAPPGPGMVWVAIVRRSVPSGNRCVSVLVETFEQGSNACRAF